MKTKEVTSLALSFLFAFLLCHSTGRAQAPASPGPEHDLLKKQAGTWNAKISMGDHESMGTVTSKMELGGLWLVSKFEGEFYGSKYEGRGMDTYDSGKKKYLSVWADSMSTQPMLMEGSYDQAKKSLTMTGTAPGPDGKPTKHRMVTQFQEDEHHTFTMYVTGEDGEETKTMTITYTRKK